MSWIINLRKKIGHAPVFLPASACLIIKDNKVLLQHRTDNGTWATHGGGLEFGETFEQALIREVNEELHIKPVNPIEFKTYSGKDFHVVYPNKDEVYIVCTMYIVEEYEGEIKPDNNEVSEVKWFDFDNLPENLHAPDVKPIYEMIEYLKNRK